MAGLLTCPIPDRLPKGNPLSGKDYRKYPRKTYSSGSVQDSHLIPFSSPTPLWEVS